MYKANSLGVLTRPDRIRHFEPSIICSADDTAGPNQRLIDLVIPTIANAWNEKILEVNTNKLDSIFFNVFPGEHYRLLKAMTTILNPKLVIEIGTYTGMGTIAIAQGLKIGSLHTFDIFPWDSMDSHLDKDLVDGSKIFQHISDLSLDGKFEKHWDLLNAADMIFLDGPKDGVFEYKLLKKLQTLHSKKGKILILDDIRFINMIDLWRSVKSPKLDITSFGHWSGTGLIDLSEKLEIL